MPVRMTKRKLPPGWMGKTSRKWLIARAMQYERIIEVGAWLGRSTLVMAKATSGTVWSVDTWQGTPGDPGQHTKLYAETIERLDPYRTFCRNLRPEIKVGKVIPVRMDSVDGAAHLMEKHGPRSFDFVFIDADHTYNGCAGDIEAYLPLMKRGGTMAGHDFHWPGVAQAVTEEFGDTVTLGPSSIWSLVI